MAVVMMTCSQAAPFHSATSKATVTFNDEFDGVLSTGDIPDAEVVELSRSRRNAELEEDAELQEMLKDARTHAGNRRSRRSTAAWWLHATIQICNVHKHLCKSIEMMEGNVKVQVRLETE